MFAEVAGDLGDIITAICGVVVATITVVGGHYVRNVNREVKHNGGSSIKDNTTETNDRVRSVEDQVNSLRRDVSGVNERVSQVDYRITSLGADITAIREMLSYDRKIQTPSSKYDPEGFGS